MEYSELQLIIDKVTYHLKAIDGNAEELIAVLAELGVADDDIVVFHQASEAVRQKVAKAYFEKEQEILRGEKNGI